MSDRSDRKVVVASGVPEPHAASYSHAIRSGQFIFCTGQVGETLDGNVRGDAYEQAKQALANLDTVLQSEGASLDDAVKLADALQADRGAGTRGRVARLRLKPRPRLAEPHSAPRPVRRCMTAVLGRITVVTPSSPLSTSGIIYLSCQVGEPLAAPAGARRPGQGCAASSARTRPAAAAVPAGRPATAAVRPGSPAGLHLVQGFQEAGEHLRVDVGDIAGEVPRQSGQAAKPGSSTPASPTTHAPRSCLARRISTASAALRNAKPVVSSSRMVRSSSSGIGRAGSSGWTSRPSTASGSGPVTRRRNEHSSVSRNDEPASTAGSSLPGVQFGAVGDTRRSTKTKQKCQRATAVGGLNSCWQRTTFGCHGL